MNKSTVSYVLLFFLSCQSNEQSTSASDDSLTKVENDSSSYLKNNSSSGALALLSLDSSARAALRNDWKKMKLRGNVKSITEDLCLLTEGRIEPFKPCKYHTVFQFNEFGFLITKIYDTDRPHKYFYDSTGQLLLRFGARCHDSTLCAGERYKYDDRGNEIEVQLWRNGKDHEKYINRFDENNRRVGQEGFSMQTGGQRFMTLTITYDDHGNVTKLIKVHEGDSTIVTYRYKYDELNRISEQVNGYKSKGIKSFIPQDPERHISPDIEYDRTTLFKYNLDGQLVEELEKGRHGLKTKITYDEHGNWIKKLSRTSKGTAHSVAERTIEYY